jgi:hypothetical protein
MVKKNIMQTTSVWNDNVLLCLKKKKLKKTLLRLNNYFLRNNMLIAEDVLQFVRIQIKYRYVYS